MLNEIDFKGLAIWTLIGIAIGSFCQYLWKELGYSFTLSILMFALLYSGAICIAFILGYYKGKNNDTK